jgi:hypothetical protein
MPAVIPLSVVMSRTCLFVRLSLDTPKATVTKALECSSKNMLVKIRLSTILTPMSRFRPIVATFDLFFAAISLSQMLPSNCESNNSNCSIPTS